MSTVINYYDNFFSVSSQKKETLQEFVKRVRNEKNLSTTQVEKKSGGTISSSYVTRIENEPYKKVSPEKLIALAKGLDITEDEIFSVARGKVPNQNSVVSEKFERLSLKFGGLNSSKKAKAEVLIEVLERELERMANEPD